MAHAFEMAFVTAGGFLFAWRVWRIVHWFHELVLAANDVPDPRTRNNAAGEKGEGERVRFNHHGGSQ